MTRNELLERYHGYRQACRTIQAGALNNLSKNGFLAVCKQLGLAVGEVIVADTEDELIYAYDLAVFTAQPGRSRAIDRYAKLHREASDDEARVLDALCHSVFSIFCLIGRDETVGVRLEDMLHGGEVWLIDEGLEASAVEDLVLAMRIATPDVFAITCGVLVPIDRDTLDDIPQYLADQHARPGAPLHELADDGHLARAIYQIAIDNGLAERVGYR